MVKVLPQRIPGQKLKLTENGNILNQGGTISVRKVEAKFEKEKRDFKSEPDLRECEPVKKTSEAPSKQKIRSRKKVRAPAPNFGSDSSDHRERRPVSEDRSRASSVSSKRDMQSVACTDNESDFNGPVVTLQKETSFRTKEPQTVNESGWDEIDNSQLRPRVALVSSDPAFQMEVKKAVQRKASVLEKPQTFYFGQNPGDMEVAVPSDDQFIVKAVVNNAKHSLPTDNSCRDKGNEIKSNFSEPLLPDNSEIEARRERINSFVNESQAGLWKEQNIPAPPPVYPLTTESEEEDDKISLHLRPTLPKKQLELPKFSPSAAWRALNDTSSQIHSKVVKSSQLLEEDIKHRSGDSGISGDTSSPAPGVEKPLAASSPVYQSWAPEQDLDASSVIEEHEELVRRGSGAVTPPKLIPGKTSMFTKNQAWSDSSSACQRAKNKKCEEITLQQPTPYKFNSIRKLKRSVSGAVSSVFSSRSSSTQSISNDSPGNWYLSRSTTQLNESADISANLSSSMPALNHDNPDFAVVSVSNRQSRIIYLPEYDSRRTSSLHRTPKEQEFDVRRAKSADPLYTNNKSKAMSSTSVSNLLKSEQRKAKKFTFKSTLRVNERKMLEEKLSREAEEKEKKRLAEAEIMRRVEEDFQRKRFAERNNVKQQLHMLQTIEKEAEKCSSLRRERVSAVRKDSGFRDHSLSEKNSDDSWEPVRRTPSGEENRFNDFERSPKEVSSTHKKFNHTKSSYPRDPTIDYSINTSDLSRSSWEEKTRQEPDGATNPPPAHFIRKENCQYRKDVISASKKRDANIDGSRMKRSMDNVLRKQHNKKSDIPSKLGIPLSMNPRRDLSPDRKKSIYKQLSEIVDDDKSSRAPSQLSNSQDQSDSRSTNMSQSISPPNSGSSRSRKIRDLKKPRRLTQELSEYREDNRREYKDYLGRTYLEYSPRRPVSSGYGSGNSGYRGSYLSDGLTSPPSGSSTESAMSPIPTDNYRRGFAHGAAPRRPTGTEYLQRIPSGVLRQYPNGYRSMVYTPEPIPTMQ
ncbi:uncharacterized protein LOC136029981 isoform X2 [Artemia franciscana]